MIRVDTGLCDLCGTCISVCPEDALCMKTVMTVDEGRCVTCLKCVRVCPVAALSRAQDTRRGGSSTPRQGGGDA